MAAKLTEELVFRTVMEVMGGQWRWGTSDCTSSACEVFRRLHDIDLLGKYRGSYSSSIQAARMMKGDFAALCHSQATKHGLQVKELAEPGDIGLIEGGLGLSLAIAINDRVWAGKTDTGFATTNKAVMIWGVKCHS